MVNQARENIILLLREPTKLMKNMKDYNFFLIYKKYCYLVQTKFLTTKPNVWKSISKTACHLLNVIDGLTNC